MATHDRGYIFVQQAVSLEALQQLLTLELPWAYVATWKDAQIVSCVPDLPQHWPQGRAFGPTLEVRWEQVGAGFTVEMLTEQEKPPLASDAWQRESPEIDGCHARLLLLWGERGRGASSPTEWIEIRIPRALSYPIEPTASESETALLRVAIEAYDYTVADVPVTTRWAQLRPTTASEEG